MDRPAPLRMAIPLAVAALLVSLSGCGRDPSVPAPAGSSAAATSRDAVSRIGDVSIRASVVPTAMLGAAVAEQYGIERDDGTVLLLVGVRQGAEARESALPARITASATDLRGVRRAVEMREVRKGELIDYVGIARVSPPDTLRFDLTIVREGGARSTMQFSRDVFPR